MREPPTSQKIRDYFHKEKIAPRYLDLVKLGMKPAPEVARQRGRDFESLLLDVFEAHQMLLRRSFHTADNSSEQIDGAVHIDGRVTLVEAKWVKSGLAASDLFAFLGKVEGKFIGTIGLFVSHLVLSPNFIAALRAGRRQSLLVIHGPEDVAKLFEPDFPMRAYLEECVKHVSIDNSPHLPVFDFLAKQKASKRADRADSNKDLRDLLGKLTAANVSAAAIASARPKEELLVDVRRLLDVFPRTLDKPFREPLRAQIAKYISAALTRLSKGETEVDRLFFLEIFPANFLQHEYLPLIEAFARRVQLLSEETRERFEQALLAAWEESIGIYDSENRLSSSTDLLWEDLRDGVRKKLLGWFIQFVNSDRRQTYPQMRSARTHLVDPSCRDLRVAVLHKMLRSEFLAMLNDDNSLPWAKKWVARSFEKARAVLPDGELDEVLQAVWDELAETGKYELDPI